MKLLFDNNLAVRLARALESDFPGSVHVRQVGLEFASDEEVWRFAKDHGLTIVSKDRDFADLAVFRGHPPKAIWLRLGNCSTQSVQATLLAEAGLVRQFIEDTDSALLVIPHRIVI